MTASPQLLLGTHYHPGGEDSQRRQRESAETLLALKQVHLVNLQFPDAVITRNGFQTRPTLYKDSVKVTGCQGTRKPIGNEALQQLANGASELGLPWFGWVNADVRVAQLAVDRVINSGLEAVVMSRMDFDRQSGKDTGVFMGGQDAFFFRTDWWTGHHHLFRAYVNSESYWDNVYTAIVLCRARSALWNREPLIRHEMHDRLWTTSPFENYNRRLAVVDSLYLEQWNRFKEPLYAMRARQAAAEEEQAWQKASFRWPPALVDRLHHILRMARLRLRERLTQK